MSSYVDDVVKITWIDSCGGHHWEMAEDFKPKIVECTSYGKVIHDDDDMLSIAGTFADDQYLAALSIPKVAIVKIENIGIVLSDITIKADKSQSLSGDIIKPIAAQ